jgi:hypothetical protein
MTEIAGKTVSPHGGRKGEEQACREEQSKRRAVVDAAGLAPHDASPAGRRVKQAQAARARGWEFL